MSLASAWGAVDRIVFEMIRIYLLLCHRSSHPQKQAGADDEARRQKFRFVLAAEYGIDATACRYPIDKGVD